MDAKKNLTPQVTDALRATGDTLAALASGQMSMLKAFADSQKRTADRLAVVEKQLAKVLGDSDPEVLDVRKKRAQSTRFVNGITSALMRIQSLRLAKSGEQAFAGTVRNADGAQARGVPVQLMAIAGKAEKKIGEARTNQFGDFSINVPLSELDPKETWKVVVQDEVGGTLASQAVAVDTSKGASAFVPLVLQPSRAQAVPATRPAAAVAKPRSSKGTKSVKPATKEKRKDEPVSPPKPAVDE